MKTDFTIREAQQTDTIALKELFQNTVLAVNRAHPINLGD